ncbi:PREDICTED: uncharacterized protein LOC106818734 [Priapulus caudatus]|uniref:Uncharacterized protein LOC106818734 n=1 Tax=Priapulus caudatus TaxID=37621 RepID=A0ABM1F371_PRICU|nr:PREDICTED: uncharacterized protein LOC106818734 [Priapulus caudatus]
MTNDFSDAVNNASAAQSPAAAVDDIITDVWCVGDKCKAPCSVDGGLHSAVVRSINARGTRKTVTVHYKGYSSEDNETVCITELRKLRPQTGPVTPTRPEAGESSRCEQQTSAVMFSPLKGNEEQSRLWEKYSALEREWESETRHQSREDSQMLSKEVGRSRAKILGSSPGRRKTGSPRANQKSSGCKRRPRSKPQTEASATDARADALSRGRASGRESGSESPLRSAGSGDDREISRVDTPGGRDRRVEEGARAHARVVDSDGDRSPGMKVEGRSDDPAGSKADDSAGGKADDRTGSKACHSATCGNQGFSVDEMERPSFSYPAPHPKVPHRLSPDGELPVVEIPAPINQHLRDYQREGVEFLYRHYRSVSGAILGDDMGLGKTVQVRRRRLDVVMTTFETFRLNVDELNEFDWTAVIVDEVHRIKVTISERHLAGDDPAIGEISDYDSPPPGSAPKQRADAGSARGSGGAATEQRRKRRRVRMRDDAVAAVTRRDAADARDEDASYQDVGDVFGRFARENPEYIQIHK